MPGIDDAAFTNAVHSALDKTALGPFVGVILGLLFFGRTALGVYGESLRHKVAGGALSFQDFWEQSSSREIKNAISWDRERTTMQQRIATLEERLKKAGLDAS